MRVESNVRLNLISCEIVVLNGLNLEILNNLRFSFSTQNLKVAAHRSNTSFYNALYISLDCDVAIECVCCARQALDQIQVI